MSKITGSHGDESISGNASIDDGVSLAGRNDSSELASERNEISITSSTLKTTQQDDASLESEESVYATQPVSLILITEDTNPIQLIHHRAYHLSNVSHDRAFLIDDGESLCNKLGEDVFLLLAQTFYKNIFEHSVPWFKAIFNEEKKDDSAKLLSDYLVQRLGGTPVYGAHKSFSCVGSCYPSLIYRHRDKHITHDVAERWLDLMDATLEELSELFDRESKEKLMNFFEFTAFKLVAAHTSLRDQERMEGDYKHLKY
mmetsp:Transcript_19699/g.19799  ORF Transcript_19699/g.19799 Transcript_19699/m.19799 type:complete len:257 (-) Transcript_19699:26-796(-)